MLLSYLKKVVIQQRQNENSKLAYRRFIFYYQSTYFIEKQDKEPLKDNEILNFTVKQCTETSCILNKIIENEEMVKKGKEDKKEKKAPFPVPEINSVPNRMFRKSNFFGGSQCMALEVNTAW